jgi:hypothetical protein
MIDENDGIICGISVASGVWVDWKAFTGVLHTKA